MSIRWKMTLLYSMLLMVLLACFSAVIYVFLQTYLYEQVTDYARDRANIVDAHSGGRGSGHSVSTPRKGLAEEFSSPGVYIQIWDQSNRLADRSSNLGNRRLPLSPEFRTFDAATEGRALDVTIPAAQTGNNIKGEHLLIWHAPLREAGQQVGLVQIGLPLSANDVLLRRAAILLALGMIVILCLVIPISLILARKLLEPIDRITQTARAITAGDLGRRIGRHGKPDEVGRLAVTFDAMIAELDFAIQTQRRFLSDAGHELRTPVTTILGHAKFLLRWPKADASERTESLEAIATTAEQMSHLVDGLLQLASSDERNDIISEPIALHDLVIEEFMRAKRSADRLDMRIEEVETLTIMGDRDQIRRLLTNLLDNAIKFTPEGGQVTASLKRIDDKAVVIVQDSGVGIPSQELPHIFERFFHADRSASAQRGGTGLGLAIVNKIILAHDAAIEVESTVGQGSTFKVLFKDEGAEL